MRYLSLILCLCGSLYSQTPATWWAQADSSQKASIRGSYDRNKQYDKGYTLAALNAIESSGGLHLIRLGEDSAGLYAQRGVNVAKRISKYNRINKKRLEQKKPPVPFDSLWVYSYNEKKDKPSGWEVSRAVQNLMLDRAFDDKHARAHLDELLRQHDGVWWDVHQAWNGRKPHQAEDVNAWIVFFKYRLNLSPLPVQLAKPLTWQ